MLPPGSVGNSLPGPHLGGKSEPAEPDAQVLLDAGEGEDSASAGGLIAESIQCVERSEVDLDDFRP
jgi:hypothetical protein